MMHLHCPRAIRLLATVFAMASASYSFADTVPQRQVEPAAKTVTPPKAHGRAAPPTITATLPPLSQQELAAVQKSTTKFFQVGVGRLLPRDKRSIELDKAIWQHGDDAQFATIEVQSLGAAAIRVAVDRRSIPKNSRLVIYGLNEREVHGPFAASGLPAAESDRLFWLPTG